METSTFKLKEWELPQRQSPAAIFMILGGISLNMLKFSWPILVLYFMDNEQDESSFWLLWIFVAFSFLSLGGTIISYWFRKFYISENHLIIQSGWLKKKKMSIPFRNIQAVHLEQNVWQQALNVTKVSFDATGSEKVEVQLEALALEKAEELKALIMGDTHDSATFKEDAPAHDHHTYQLGFGDLLKLCLTANHLEAFLILLVFGFNLFGEIRRVFDINEQDYIDTYAQELLSQTSFLIIVFLSGLAIISLLFSFVRTFLKFFDFRLTDNGHSWKISHGLFNRQQKSIPLNKIQIISWRTSWLRRKFDYWIIHVQSVGQSKRNQKQHVQIPILAFSQIVKLADSYQEFTGIDPVESNGIDPAYWKRKSLLIGLPLAIIPMLISLNWIGLWALSFALLFVYTSGHYYMAYKTFRWKTNPKGLQILSGVWGRKFILLNWKKVQQVHLHQSPYQRRKRLANVIFITAGGKVILPYLELATANALADQVLYEVESKNESWM